MCIYLEGQLAGVLARFAKPLGLEKQSGDRDLVFPHIK